MTIDDLDVIAQQEAGRQYAHAVEAMFDKANNLSRSRRAPDHREAMKVAWEAVKLRDNARRECHA